MKDGDLKVGKRELRTLEQINENNSAQETALKAFDKVSSYELIENFVGSKNAEVVKQHYQAANHEEQDDWSMAIQVHIACGERKDLEEEFPEWAGANPANHDWS